MKIAFALLGFKTLAAVSVVVDLYFAAKTIDQVTHGAYALAAVAGGFVSAGYLCRLIVRLARQVSEAHSVLVGDENNPSAREFQASVTERLKEGDERFDKIEASVTQLDRSLEALADAERAGVRATIASHEKRSPGANL